MSTLTKKEIAMGEPKLYWCCQKEAQLSDALQTACVVEIERLGDEAALAVLGWPAGSFGLKRLTGEPHWNLPIAVRAADALGLAILDQIIITVQHTDEVETAHTKLQAIEAAAQRVANHDTCNMGARCYMDETEALGIPYARAYPCNCLKELLEVIGVSNEGE